MCDTFPIKGGLNKRIALSPLLFNFVLGSATRSVQVNQDGLKLNYTYQLVVYIDDVKIFGGRVHTVKEKAEALVVASKERRPEVNGDKSKYIITPSDRNARRSQRIRTDNSSFERVEFFKYLGQTYQIKFLFKKKLRAD